MKPNHLLRLGTLTVLLAAAGCSGPPPGGLNDYVKNIEDAEQFLKSKGVTLAQKTFAMNQTGWSVDMSGKEIGDDMLEAIGRLQAVGEVIFTGSSVADDQLQKLGAVSPLYMINLSKTGVSDGGLAHLKHNTIRELDVTETKVTADAVAALKKRYATDTAVHGFFRNIKIKH